MRSRAGRRITFLSVNLVNDLGNLDRLEFSACGDEAPVIGALAWATGEG